MKRISTGLFKLFMVANLLLPLTIMAQCPANVTVTSGNTGTWVNTASGIATVRITAVGAGGGKNTMVNFPGDGQVNTLFGGSGASMSGTFTVAAGATLFLIAGAPGANSNRGGAGGGASGAVNCGNPSNCASGTVLLLAGGGGGTSGFLAGGGGKTASGGGGGGTNGGQNAAGGGGLNAAGQNGVKGPGANDVAGTGGDQVSYTGISNGGAAGVNNNIPGAAGGAGMGGGGGTDGGTFAAGGGGQTGGNAENLTTTAQGGNSLNSGTTPTNTSGANGGGANAGSVMVQCLSVALPVELIHFSANLTNASTSMLAWQTASELNNAGFEIERSENGKAYRTIGWVDGKGTTTEQNDYSFADDNLPKGKTYYYRLRQVDYDGQFEYSPVATVTMGGKGTVVGEFYPNPSTAGGLVRLDFTAVEEGQWQVNLYDSMGRAANAQNGWSISVSKGQHTVLFDFDSLPTGIYFVKIENGLERLYRKLVVE